MSYFNHSFNKVFIGTGGVRKTGNTSNLVPGELGLFNYSTFQAIDDAGINPAPHRMFIVAQGSYHAKDKLSPFYGGLSESVKSRGINSRFISKYWLDTPKRPTNEAWAIGYNGVATCEGIAVVCGEKYTIRVEVKGDSVLRTYNRNLYKEFTVETPCCDDCATDCEPATSNPFWVATQMVNQINSNVEMSTFIKASVI